MFRRSLLAAILWLALSGCPTNEVNLPRDTGSDVDMADAADMPGDAADAPEDDVGDADMPPSDMPPDAADMPDLPDVADMADMPGGLRPLATAVVATGLTSPVALTSANDGTGRIFVVDQVGLIYAIDDSGDRTTFADLRDRLVTLMNNFDERGLLGLAFHPDFASNRRLYIFYSAPLRASAPDDFNHTNVISEFMVDATGAFDPDSERILLEIDHPYFNHNGGTVAFGDDGFLYISLGDGGNRNDQGIGHDPAEGNAQLPSGLLGSILRIDVDAGDPYAIPPDNPFVGTTTGRDEIFAYGLRNPYRISFDLMNGELFVGDAGQDIMEEVSVVEIGDNLGWRIKEGTLCFNPDDPLAPLESCATQDSLGRTFTDPILTFTRPLSAFDEPSPELQALISASPVVGLVVVGGNVYRGAALPEYDGRYIFGSWSDSFGTPAGKVFIGTQGGDQTWSISPAVVDGNDEGLLPHFVLGFGQDAAGEVYVLVTDQTGPMGTSGQVLRLVAQ